MEGETIRLLSEQSEQLRGLKYVKYIGDGDSKGFSEVRDAQPYGPDLPVEKEECIGHV